MDPERIIPRIFYTQYEHVWSAERLRDHSFTHIVRIDHQHQAFEASAVDHNANEQPMCDFAGFDLVDLDFNSSPYATSVLPSCYKSVKFIERAMRGSGSVLIVGAGEDNALAIVIVVGYLMYKDHLRFRTVYQQLKLLHPRLELDIYYQLQLREYEPILQATTAQFYGAGCSSEFRANGTLKRKTTANCDECCPIGDAASHHESIITTTTAECTLVRLGGHSASTPLTKRPISADVSPSATTTFDTAMVE